jgi:hypothetical protein
MPWRASKEAATMSDPALEAHEHAEHAEHAAHENNPFISQVSITIALLAVVAAITGSLETLESGGAIIGANDAVLAQDQATDKWGEFEAKSLKKNLYLINADAGGPKADSYRAKAKDEGVGQDTAAAKAKEFEAESKHAQALSQLHEERHHRLTFGATLLEIGIAMSTIAIITRKRWPWAIASLLGLSGAVVGASAYLAM